MNSENPLLRFQHLPPFAEIRAEHIKPALAQVLEQNLAEMERLIAEAKPYTWDNFVRPLEDLNDRVDLVWGPAQHLHSVADSEALRQAYNDCLPLLSDYRSAIGQNQGMFAAYQALANSEEFASLSPAQQKTIENELRDFRLSGIDLPPEQQQRFKEIDARLSKLAATFSEHLLDASDAWILHITDEKDLNGLPNSVKSMLREQAERKELEGWLITLDLPCYIPAMNYLDKRELRQKLYHAFATRASELGANPEWDNSAVMEEILQLRHEQAQLLGFKNYAELSLTRKMAETPQQVLDFLYDLAQRSRAAAEKDLAEVRAFALEQDDLAELTMWDVPYYSEKLREHRYALSQETLRPYFALPNVLNGLFEIIKRLYGMSIREREGVETWDASVRFYELFDETNTLRGQFYFDPYTRPGKRSGAWMGGQRERRRYLNGEVQIPLAYIVCNFGQPSAEAPTLLRHQEVTTLFHEFGHGLHHMLTLVDYPSVAGISGVPWDAVELPSQFLENWAWEREALNMFAKHYHTGEPLPDDVFAKMQAAKNFQSGLFMLRQLEFALFDFRLHAEYQPGNDSTWIQGLINEVREQVAVLAPPEFNRFQHSFQHIFAGGYAAGYYSYKWAEVLSADAFSKFEEDGIFNPQTGHDFMHHILEQGGAYDPRDLFVRFRGREPQIDALLKHSGLAA